jgi:hypothetical protein
MSVGDVRTPVPSGLEYDELASQFRYERAQLSEDRSSVRTIESGLRLEDLSWQSPRGGRVPAWLVVPERSGRHAAVLFLTRVPATATPFWLRLGVSQNVAPCVSLSRPLTPGPATIEAKLEGDELVIGLLPRGGPLRLLRLSQVAERCDCD